MLDQRGSVVGVVTSKLNALKVALKDGDLPRNVSFAVKSSLLVSFLKANRVTYDRLRDDSERVASADLAQIGQKISGFVICR